MTNPGGEKYILDEVMFTARYCATENKGVYRPTGKIKAIPNPYTTNITILAPWGKKQYGAADCYIAALFDEKQNRVSAHRYIIEHDAFHQTYSEKID